MKFCSTTPCLFCRIFVFFLLFTSCKNDLKQAAKLIDPSTLNSERADEVTIIYSKNGHTSAKLFTPKFNHIQNVAPTYVEMNKGLRVQFYDDSMHVQSTLTAKYGKYFEKEGNVLVRDSVVIYNAKNEQLDTQELIWNEKLQQFYTEKFVKISTPTQIIYGDGLISNQSFSEYKITNVKGIIGVKKGSIPFN
jgi:LPS export ABC transporter protein LptC